MIFASGWVISGTAADGVVRVAAHGGDHAPLGTDASPDPNSPRDPHPRPSADQPEYARHGFASHAGPDYNLAAPIDNTVTLLAADGRPAHRRPTVPVSAGPRVAASRSRAHWLVGEPPIPWRTEGEETWEVGPWLTSGALLHGPWEVRLARMDPIDPDVVDPETGARSTSPLRLHFGGWSVAGETPPQDLPDLTTVAPAPALAASGVVTTAGLRSLVVGLRGLGESGVHRSTDQNPFGPHSAAPWARSTAPLQPGEVYAALVILSGSPVSTDVTVEVAGDQISVHWPDGQTDSLHLPGPASPKP